MRLLVRALNAACEAHPDAIALDALDGEGRRLTYRALWQRAEEVAARLVESGVHTGAPVLVKCSNEPSDFVALLAVWMSGGVAAPVSRSLPTDVLDAIQAKAQSRLILDLLGQSPDSWIAHTLASGPMSDARSSQLEDGALVIFTSGTTGLPKGVVLSHTSFHGKLQQNHRLFGPSAATTTLLVLNNTFSFGIWVGLMTLTAGGKVVLMSKFTPVGFLESLVSAGVTFVAVVPTMMRSMFGSLNRQELAAARRRIVKAKSLQSVAIGGESLGAELSEELRQFLEPARLYDVYGLTETSTSDFVLDPADYAAHPASIGKPFPGINFRVADEHGHECLPNTVGELQLKTPYIMKAYLGDEEITKAAFHDGWFRTGDLATVDEEGFVTITGRLKEIIVRGANKISPLEVERALVKCNCVAGALVTGMADPILGQRIHALLVPNADLPIDLASVRRELESRLERFKFPDVFYLAASLPTGRTGKIDRKRFQELITSGSLRPHAGC